MPERYVTIADRLDVWRGALLSGEPPRRFRVGDGDLSRLEIGPGLMTLIGGAPGAGKTALVMQMAVDALRNDPDLRALVANVEMSPEALFERQLARLSGIPLDVIRYRRLTAEHAGRLDYGLGELASIGGRLAFVNTPIRLETIAEAADQFQAELLILDYVQRIPPPGEHGDKRGALDTTMGFLRRFCDHGAGSLWFRRFRGDAIRAGGCPTRATR